MLPSWGLSSLPGAAGRRTDEVKRRRHTPEQIIRNLCEADRMLSEGAAVPEVAKALEV